MAVKMLEKQLRDVSPAIRRAAVVAAVLLVAVAVIGIAALVRSRGSGDKTVQTVAGNKITQHDLELTVEHFHEAADREGKPFPAKGTDGYKRVELLFRRYHRCYHGTFDKLTDKSVKNPLCRKTYDKLT